MHSGRNVSGLMLPCECKAVYLPTHFASSTVPTVPSWLTISTAASWYVLQMRSAGCPPRLTAAALTPTGKPGGCTCMIVLIER